MAEKREACQKVLVKLPKGTILTDTLGTQWEVLEPIGEGGFGVIYSTKKVKDSVRNEYAMKVEPYDNGPMFVERNFFIRCLKPEMLNKYKREHKLSFLGLPKYIGGGTHNMNNVSVRFLVMERFGENINSRLKSSSKINLNLLGTFCSQIVDALMYIHRAGYVHMDIKPENLMLKYNSKGDQVYVIDFGVIEKCTTDSVLTPDKRKEHNGTPLYSSRDSHLGVGTKRGDLEVLGYNILRWLDVELPWTKNILTPTVVQAKKISFMQKLPTQLLHQVPDHIIEFLKYVNKLRHDEVPDYALVKSLLNGKVGLMKSDASIAISTQSAASTSTSERLNDGEILTRPPSKRFRSRTPPMTNKKIAAERPSQGEILTRPPPKRFRSRTPPMTNKRIAAGSSGRQSKSVKRC